MRLTIVARNGSCAIYRLVLSIVSAIGCHPFLIRGEAPSECLGAEDYLDLEESSWTYFLEDLSKPPIFNVSQNG